MYPHDQMRPDYYHTAPPPAPPPAHSPAAAAQQTIPAPARQGDASKWVKVIAIVALVLAVIGTGIGAGGLIFGLRATSKSSVQATQISQLQKQMSSIQFTEHNDYTTLNGKIIGLTQSIAPVLTFNTVCSQDLTGSSGPAQFDFLCSEHRPG